MVKLPTFPGPDQRDTPEVAKLLAAAADLWSSQRYADALPILLNAALLASARAPATDPRVKQLAAAATEISAYVHSPGSIPISLPISAIEAPPVIATPPKPPPRRRARKGTLPEESRPAPDTVRVEPNVPPPPTVDLTGTLPQGVKPAPTTRRLEDIPTERAKK